MIQDVDIQEIYSKIKSPEASAALEKIMAFVSSENKFDLDCRERWDSRKKGFLYDIRFFDEEEQNLYAIIPTQKWLLWYFRKPALKTSFQGIHNTDSIKEKLGKEIYSHNRDENEKRYAKVNENEKGEITIRLLNPANAQNLIDKYLQ